MILPELSQDEQLEHIVESLQGELGDTVPVARIAAEARQAYTDLTKITRAPAFVPILALRRARAALVAP